MSDEVLVTVDNVSKKFCKSLKRSLWYGLQDTARELNPFATNNPQPRIKNQERLSCNLQPATCNLPNQELLSSSLQPATCNLQPVTSPTKNQELPPLRADEFWAVRNISFELKRGECLGLIGHNGAGKSTLLKMLNGLIKPDTGRIEMRGRIGALIELGAGFNPILTGRENIYNKGAILGFAKKEIDRRFDEIVEFSEIKEFIDMPVQNYSSGMKVRLGFAVSAMMDPDVLIIDEVLAVGDMGFIIKCLNRMAEIIPNAAAIFVSHSMPMISRISTQIILMDHGQIEYSGHDTAAGIAAYLRHFAGPVEKISGSGKARLKWAKLMDADGEDVQSLNSGDSSVLEFAVQVHESVSEVNAAVYVYNQEMRPVAFLGTRELKPIKLHMTASREVVCKVYIDRMSVKMGRNFITVIVSNPETRECYVRVDNAVVFDVVSSEVSWADTVWACHTEVATAPL